MNKIDKLLHLKLLKEVIKPRNHNYLLIMLTRQVLPILLVEGAVQWLEVDHLVVLQEERAGVQLRLL